jgi:hypothetical protein
MVGLRVTFHEDLVQYTQTRHICSRSIPASTQSISRRNRELLAFEDVFTRTTADHTDLWTQESSSSKIQSLLIKHPFRWIFFSRSLQRTTFKFQPIYLSTATQVVLTPMWLLWQKAGLIWCLHSCDWAVHALRLSQRDEPVSRSIAKLTTKPERWQHWNTGIPVH